MITVRLKLDILEESLSGGNEEFIMFFLENYIANYKNEIKIILFGNIDLTNKINNLILLFKKYNVDYDIATYTNNKITIDVLEDIDDYIFNGRFKIYYEHNQNSYINALVNLASITDAIINNKINTQKKSNKESIIEEIKLNKIAQKRALHS
ncbi:MAG TPA: hypothetical protein PLY35_08290 [Thermotogota bacterium]|nr:hypothetical protein [Thermotogota bacterium]